VRLDAPAYQLKRHDEGNAILVRTAITYNRSRRNAQIEYSGRRRAAVRSGAAMTWEWEHPSTGGQWILTSGVWHAVVQRVTGARPQWQATLTRTVAPRDHYASPSYSEAVDARTWCLRRIAELADNRL
jgi:hypothetical protein